MKCSIPLTFYGNIDPIYTINVRGVRTGSEDYQEQGQARRVTSSVYACG
jgi:hypothetical protein